MRHCFTFQRLLPAALLAVALTGSGCIGVYMDRSEGDGGPNPLLALLALGGGGAGALPPTDEDISSPPELSIPSLGDFSAAFAVSESEQAPPENVDGKHVAVGRVYTVELDPNNVDGLDQLESSQHVLLEEAAELRYSYDVERLQASGFMEEFQVYYYDGATASWRPVERVSVDRENQTVTAYTRHFTPFVLTALPVPTGAGTADAPACLSSDAPLAGSAGASWMIVDDLFKYYQDRNYFIEATEAGDSFYDLGFERAVGIATCNGGTGGGAGGTCGSFTDHKHNRDATYIEFTAPRDIDVYVMYDSRDTPAPWLASRGFARPAGDPVVHTTDDVGAYHVYRRSYSEGETVDLAGNHFGIPGSSAATGVQTNYWVVIKSAGVTTYEAPSSLCTNGNPGALPTVSAAAGIPGADRALLLWANPDDASIANVLIRRRLNAPTLSPLGGEAPTGSELRRNAYVDLGLTQDQTYYYTIFTLDSEGNHSVGRVVEVSTGVDSDGDGLKDGYEGNPANSYPFSGGMTATDNADSDGDGASDWQEIVNGTDPTNPDAQAPVVTQFTRTSPSPTDEPYVAFQSAATDNAGVVYWALTESPTPPLPMDQVWQTTQPARRAFQSTGDYSLYLWAMDAAGNVSAPVAPITVTVNGLSFHRFTYAAQPTQRIIVGYEYDLETGEFQEFFQTNPGRAHAQLMLPESQDFLYVRNQSDSHISVFSIEDDGRLTHLQDYNFGYVILAAQLHPEGHSLYVRHQAPRPSGAYSPRVSSLAIGGDGRITGTRTFALETDPRDSGPLSMHPEGSAIYAGNTEEGWLSVFYSATGSLSYVNYYTGFGEAARLAMEPLGRFGYSPWGDQQYELVQISGVTPGRTGQRYSIVSGAQNNLNTEAFHPNGQYMYVVVNGSGAAIVRVLQIDASGALSAVRQYSIPNGFYRDARTDLLGRKLTLVAGNQLTIFDIRDGEFLENQRTLTLSSSGESLASVAHVEGNLPPFPFIEVYGSLRYLGVYQGGDQRIRPFPNAHEVGRYVSFGLRYRDLDEDLCNADPRQYAHAMQLLQGSASYDQFQTYDQPYLERPYHYQTYRFDAREDVRVRYEVTDDPGTCAGDPRTASIEADLAVRNVSYSERSLRPYGNLPAQSPTLQADVEARYSLVSYPSGGHRWRLSPVEYVRKTCTVFAHRCSLESPTGNLGGLRISCEDISFSVSVTGKADEAFCETPDPLWPFYPQGFSLVRTTGFRLTGTERFWNVRTVELN